MIYQLGDKTPQIDETVFIADSADIVGHVALKENTSVWFNAVIRGDGDLIEVGARTIFKMAQYYTVILVSRWLLARM